MTGRLAMCLAATVALVGCGVQAGGNSEAKDRVCAEVEPYLAVKRDGDALDREMLAVQPPTTVTPETVRSLAPKYRDGSGRYADILDRAETELARARSAQSELTEVWELMTESLTIRRDGFDFFARTFANPERLRDPQVAEELEEIEPRMLDSNSRLEQASKSFLREHGFEETADGQFIIDC